jgi:hypothetical protein
VGDVGVQLCKKKKKKHQELCFRCRCVGIYKFLIIIKSYNNFHGREQCQLYKVACEVMQAANCIGSCGARR